MPENALITMTGKERSLHTFHTRLASDDQLVCGVYIMRTSLWFHSLVFDASIRELRKLALWTRVCQSLEPSDLSEKANTFEPVCAISRPLV